MKAYITALLLLIITTSATAGDTTWVQTFTFDSLMNREGRFFFPTAGQQYRKILMYTTLKCFPTVSGDNKYPCGEWDILSYHNVYDHRGKLDSTPVSNKLFSVDGAYPDSVRYTTKPQYDLYQSYQRYRVITATTSLNTFQSGNGSVSHNAPFMLADSTGHSQFIWKASELSAAGLTPGNISGIRLQFANNNSAIERLHIRMRHIPADSFAANVFFPDSLSTVFFHRLNTGSAGWKDIQFTQPFTWNGTDAVLIDFSFENPGPQPANPLLGSNTAWTSGLYTSGVSYCTGNTNNATGMIRFGKELNMFSGKEPRTYEMWAYIDTQGTLFSSGGTWQNYANYSIQSRGGNRWGLTTWGGDPGFTTDNPQKVWKHYAITYDGAAVTIYQNGIQKDRITPPINTTLTADFRIGGWHENAGDFYGKLSHLRIWDKALDAVSIQAWMNREVTSAHPDYTAFRAAYDLNEGNGGFVAGNTRFNHPPGEFQRNFWWHTVKGSDLYYNAQPVQWRPNIIFERGVYTSHLDSTLITDTVRQAATIIDIYNYPDHPYIIHDSASNNPALRTERRVVWNKPWSYTYLNGIRKDSTAIVRDSILHNRTKSWYSNTVAYEIGRYITPYGINLNMGDGKTWIYDVTDYYGILQDTVHLASGTNLELQDVRFAFIKGAPPARVTHIGQPWFKGHNTKRFKDLADNTSAAPAQVKLHPDTRQLRLRARLTGHGFQTSNAGGAYPHCCEFWENTHYFYAGNQQLASWKIFQECGYNPLYPQGGTWTTPREGWCPGDMVPDKNVYVDLSRYASGGNITLDYGISPVPANNPGLGLGDYVMSLQAIEYADPGRENDAELYDIIRPTDQFYHSRINPVCSNPAIIIRNAGSKPLTTAEIRYYVAGGKAEIYTWNGNLQFMETETVTLPISGTDFWNGKQVFTAVITGANNTTDEYALNDTASVHYSIPDNFSTDKIVVAFRTNNSPSHNVLTIQNFNGDTLLLRNNLAANHSYNDTLLLPRGCYTLKLTDAGHDGLSFWANPGQGTGSLQIRSGNSPFPLKTFGADFGAEILYAFSTGFPMEVYDTDKPFSFEIFPNPANGAFYIRLSGYTGNVNLQLTNLIGQQIMTDAVQCSGGISEKKYDLQLTAGIYLLKAGDGNNISTLRLVVRD